MELYHANQALLLYCIILNFLGAYWYQGVLEPLYKRTFKLFGPTIPATIFAIVVFLGSLHLFHTYVLPPNEANVLPFDGGTFVAMMIIGGILGGGTGLLLGYSKPLIR